VRAPEARRAASPLPSLQRPLSRLAARARLQKSTRAAGAAVVPTGAVASIRIKTAATPTHNTLRAAHRGSNHVHATDRPARQPDAHLPGGADSRGFPAGHARRIPPAGLARNPARLDHHLRARGLGMEAAVRRRLARLPVWRGNRRVERRLDYRLGHGAVQHAVGERCVREFPPLADRAGRHGRTRSDDAVRMGFRSTARRPGRFRLSVGGGGADPDLARHLARSAHRSSRSPP